MKEPIVMSAIGTITFAFIDNAIRFSTVDFQVPWERELVGDKFTGEEFLEMVDRGTIMDDDGCIANVWVDNRRSNLGLFHEGISQGKFLVDAETWSEVCASHEVIVEWCNR